MNERRNDLEIMNEAPRIAPQIPNSDRSPLYDVRYHAPRGPSGQRVRSDVSRTMMSRPAASASIFDFIWWSQTGSNRRPHACKARALPAELWPRTRRRMLQARRKLNERHMRSIKVVGLGRLELPTSRLSSARSNQLSYKPLHKERARAHGVHAKCVHADVSHKPSPWRVFVREERETKTAKSRQWSSTIWRSMAPDVSKTI